MQLFDYLKKKQYFFYKEINNISREGSFCDSSFLYVFKVK